MTLAMIKNPEALTELPNSVQAHIIDKSLARNMRCTKQVIFKFGGYDIRMQRHNQISAFTVTVEGRPHD